MISSHRLFQLTVITLPALLAACGPAEHIHDDASDPAITQEEELGVLQEELIESADEFGAEEEEDLAVMESEMAAASAARPDDKIRFWTFYNVSGGKRAAPIREGNAGFGWKHMHDKHNIDDEKIIKD